jgi:hypothetical protein
MGQRQWGLVLLSSLIIFVVVELEKKISRKSIQIKQ